VAHNGVVDGSASEKNGHEYDGARGSVDGEETEEADFGYVDSDEEMLEGPRVGEPFGVDPVGHDIEDIVPHR